MRRYPLHVCNQGRYRGDHHEREILAAHLLPFSKLARPRDLAVFANASDVTALRSQI
jgi:hypothetical protein